MVSDWQHNLIKGRIAEVIFELMFREAGGFTVIKFGYENIVPELTQYKEAPEANEALDKIKASPDFVLINQTSRLVHLVEVKYRRKPSLENNLDIAIRMKKNWDPSWLFLASPDYFFLDEVSRIIENNGKMDFLPYAYINEELNRKYLSILKEFEPK
jgi:hypothetical protein